MTATIKSGTINLLNTIIGAGVLAMPFGIKANGLVFGIILIIWSSFTSAFGLYLQTKVSKYTKQQQSVSFFSLAQLTYPSLSIVFDSAIAIKCFGVGVSYLVIIGDLMPQIMDTVGALGVWLHRNLWITIFMVVIVIPLSYLRRLDSLKYTSIVALFSVVYLVLLVIYHLIFNEVDQSQIHFDWIGPISWDKTLSSFPILIFAYTCHQNMFAIINELQPNESGSKTRQSNWIIRNAISLACFTYLLVGVTGYFTFGSSLTGNIITLYSKTSIGTLIGRLCIVIMVSLSFPLQCHPCRGSVNHVIFFISEKFKTPAEETDSLISEHDESFVSTTPMEGAHDMQGHDPVVVPLTSRTFYSITTVIILASYLVAISVTSLERVLAFVGSTGSTSISFILPGLFGYLLINPLEGSKLTTKESFCKYGGLCLSLWGVLVMIVCLGATIFLGATH